MIERYEKMKTEQLLKNILQKCSKGICGGAKNHEGTI